MFFFAQGMIFFFLLFSCKSDKTGGTTADPTVEELFEDEKGSEPEEEEVSKLLFAKLDRLKIRSDSSMSAKTVTVVSENDSLVYLDVYSTRRENLRLRKRNYHEPWLKVEHLKSGKRGWVYGGAVKYESAVLSERIKNSSPLLSQVYADDLEWEGTVPSGWATASFSDPVEFKLFLIRFKDMVKNDNINEIADVVSFPLKDIKNKADFKANYARLMSENLKSVVAEQRLDRIFRNSQGASLGDGDLWFQQDGSSYKIVSWNFKGRSDLTNDLMASLSDNYVTNSPSGKQSIKAFSIKGFLELTLNYQGQNGFPESRSLGRFLHETSHNGRHSFYQDTKDSLQRRLLFEIQDSFVILKISNDMDLENLKFVN